MNPRVAQVLERLHERMAAEHAEQERITREQFSERLDEWMLAVGEGAGRLLNLLVKTAGAQTIVEVGTSVGYSTVWLAEAARATGGRVITLDTNPEKHRQAGEYLAEAGLLERVEFHTADAETTLAQLDGPFDFVLLDCWKDAYLPCFRALWPRMAPGGLVAADNIITPAAEGTRLYVEHVRALDDAETVMVPIDNGIELTRKVPAAE